jgi:hypothetical protein
MDTIQISKKDALQAFRSADKKGKELLKSLFGDIEENIKDKVRSFEDACAVLGITTNDAFPDAHIDYLKKDIASINAYCQLIVITRALNEGWEPDWSNDDEYKYYPWFSMDGGFSLRSVFYDCASSSVGSRLCFRSEELAKYAATQFLSIYKDFFTIKP